MDLAGQQFGSWTVLEHASHGVTPKGQKYTRWLCRCICGTEKLNSASNLRAGNTQSCGCGVAEDLTGQTFGNWTVIGRTRHQSRSKSGRKHVSWHCRCVCGNERVYYPQPLKALVEGASCGCIRRVTKAGNIYGSGYVRPDGYRMVSRPNHPNAKANGAILEHVWIMSNMLERPLRKGENVHHKNGVRHDNRPENLELWYTYQPHGQRVEDLLDWAYQIIEMYGPEQFTLRLVS